MIGQDQGEDEVTVECRVEKPVSDTFGVS